MRVRTVVSGISAGAMCFVFLRFQVYVIELSKIVPGWPFMVQAASFPSWTMTVFMIFCGVILFIFGWVAARWNWEENWWASLQSGSGMGILAGCLIFNFIGVPWYGLKGQSEILMTYYYPLSEPEGLRIVIEAIAQTSSLLYTQFVYVVLACALLGGLGGLTSALISRRDFWGKDPRRPEGWLFRLPAYLLTIFGFLNLIVTVAVLRLLQEKVMKSVTELESLYDIQWRIPYPGGRVFIYAYLVGLIFMLLPLGITWGCIIRSWYVREKPGGLGVLWIFATTLGSLPFLLGLRANAGIPVLVVPAFAFGLGLGVGITSKDRSEGFPYHISDWVGYGLTYGILGGTQIFMGVVAYAVTLALITIVNIPHLVKAEPVEKTPVEQVVRLFNSQNWFAIEVIVVSLIIGLIVASLASFLRTVLGVKDVPPASEYSNGIYTTDLGKTK